MGGEPSWPWEHVSFHGTVQDRSHRTGCSAPLGARSERRSRPGGRRQRDATLDFGSLAQPMADVPNHGRVGGKRAGRNPTGDRGGKSVSGRTAGCYVWSAGRVWGGRKVSGAGWSCAGADNDAFFLRPIGPVRTLPCPGHCFVRDETGAAFGPCGCDFVSTGEIH